MLINPDISALADSDYTKLLGGEYIHKLSDGVYEMYYPYNTFSMNDYDSYPNNLSVFPYGTCDNYQQILDKCPELVTSDREFIILLIPVYRSDQPSEKGWRWSMHGSYLGDYDVTSEYLVDESIDKLYEYQILERVSN